MNCTPQEQTDAEQYIDSPDFITEVAKRNPESKPWAMQFGGWGEAVADALEGGTHKRDPVVVGANTGELRAERAVAVLEELGKLSEQDTTTVEVGDIHVMNALPAEGDYKKLMADFRKNVKPMLLDPGKKISTQKMPKAKAGYLYDRYMDKFAGVYKTKRALPKLTAAFANRPTADMTPRELAVHVSTQVEAFKREMAKNDRDDWAKPQAKKPDKAQLSDWFKKRKAEYDKYFSDTVKSDLATEMAVPEFVIADTNWGDEGNHQLFVIAPDPLTGEPDLWSKSVIGGKLSQVDDRWLKAEWSKISK